MSDFGNGVSHSTDVPTAVLPCLMFHVCGCCVLFLFVCILFFCLCFFVGDGGGILWGLFV